MGWEEYFSIYPFTQDREDYRVALLASVISNMSGKTLKKPVEVDRFLPEYLRPERIAEKSLEEQAKDWASFKHKLNEMQKASKRDK